ncbi:MAG: protein kinase [Verrucomicrobiales bacterium]|nr:protein kinase [Verrucomicrobiales bacterium]
MNQRDDREEMVFEAALQLPAAQRGEYLDQTCAHDPELRRRVEGLLGAFERATGLLGEPAALESAKSLVSSHSVTEQVGDKIGRYKLLQQIGEGGCGVVYMAEQEEPVRRKVALKVIKLGMDTKQVVAWFEAERQALALMDHPNIAKVLDAGATDTGRPFFVMELVRGIKITDYCDQNNLSTSQRLDLFIQVCQAVQHAHQKGIIHRDLKPSNILVTQHDSVAVPKVIDFGIAKATTDQRLTDKTLFTAFEQFMGTPAYMSPEQAQMSGLDIDTRTDIYSLGVLLYELLTGKTPFDAKELIAAGLDEMRKTICEREPPRPSTKLRQNLVAADVRRLKSPDGSKPATEEEVRASSRRLLQIKETIHLLRGDLDWIVMKCLEKDRTRRYETANGLAMEINRHLNQEPVLARPPSTIYRFQKLVRRNKLAFAAATIVTMALMLSASISIWQAIRATKESVRARGAERRAREESELAKRQERRANANLYAANMRLAQFAWEQNNAGQVRQLLEETEAFPVRGFEWYYWQRQTHLQFETLRGHRELILAVAASPDGRWIVTGSQDGMAKVWEMASGNPPRTLGGHRGEVSSVAFSPSGQRIVTGSQDHTAKVWDAVTGQEQLALRGHSHWVWSAIFSADGHWIVTGSHDHTAKVWDAISGEELRNFREHSGPIYSVAVSPDGQQVATASEDLTARVWDLATGGGLFPPLKGHIRPISSVAFSRDGQRLATGSFDQTAKVWDPASGTELFTVRGHGSPISSVTFSADGQRLITGGGSVGVTPTAAAIEPGMGDGTAKVWAATGGRETLTLRGHTDKVMAVAFSPDSQRIITGSFDKTAAVWDAGGGKALFTLSGHDKVRAVSFSPDGQRLVAGYFDGIAQVWSATGDRVLAELKGHTDKILAVSFSSDGERIVTGSADNTARVWSAVDGQHLATLAGDGGWIFSVSFSPDGQWVATGSNDGRAGIWDVATTNRLHVLTAHDWGVNGVAFSPDGQRIVTGCGNGIARIWDTRTGKELLALAGHNLEIYSVAFSPDGQRVVTAGKDRAAKVWDASDGLELLTLTGHTDVIWAVAFSPDGQRIVTGSWDNSAKVWQAATPKEVLRWRAEEPTRKQLVAAARQDAALRRQDPGAIKQLLVLLPFPYGHKDGARALQDEQVVGERLLRPRAGERIQTGGSNLVWQPVELDDYVIDFGGIAARNTDPSSQWGVAYAVCYVRSETAQPGVSLKVGSDDQARVYLNGELIYEFTRGRSYVADQDVVTGLELKAGINVLVFKVVNETSGWHGSIRLTDSEGKPLNGIRVTLTPPSVADSKPQPAEK